ncbi:hypothetical protein DW927_03105 [Roseburia intestinalis]|jgi:hypothetical protein|uniref:Uncharacterized protein n=1 Tax=Roseburia intestinalis TaxID=166486 RepID=A0A3R6AA54_9FIRM|nr:hypothetical protein [Roseburia intestinalis]RHA69812.1 hypothetical protein DW927_03105 [Roseburia intestinalis]
MSKSNKELAVDVAIEYIRAHQKQITVSSNNVFKETRMIDLESVNNVIKSVHKTLNELDQSTD